MTSRILLLLLLTSFACAKSGSVSESQCAAGDWQTIGYRDGTVGYRSTRLLAHQDACVPHGVIPDRESYMAGWQQGVIEFCEPNNGFAVGRNGQRYDNVCPGEQRDAFLEAYKQGRTLFLAKAEVLDLERRLHAKRLRLESVKQEIVTSATAQLNPLLTPAQRVELVAQAARLNDERSLLETEIPRLESELALKAEEFEALDQSMAALTF
jgi:hypothetical protein